MIAAKLATAVNSAAPPIAWQPDKAVDLVAANAPGGRAARILRVAAKATQVAPYAEAEVAARGGPREFVARRVPRCAVGVAA